MAESLRNLPAFTANASDAGAPDPDLAIEDIDHSRTKTKSPQTNGICERFHKTMLDEFYRVAFRKKLYRSLAELQADVDQWLRHYNEVPHPPGLLVLRQDTHADLP